MLIVRLKHSCRLHCCWRICWQQSHGCCATAVTDRTLYRTGDLVGLHICSGTQPKHLETFRLLSSLLLLTLILNRSQFKDSVMQPAFAEESSSVQCCSIG